jgi:hypothetical protein
MISKLESGKSKGTADIVSIATACRVRPEWLANEDGAMLDQSIDLDIIDPASRSAILHLYGMALERSSVVVLPTPGSGKTEAFAALARRLKDYATKDPVIAPDEITDLVAEAAQMIYESDRAAAAESTESKPQPEHHQPEKA